MRRHLNTAHSIYYSACKENFVHVAVQSWYNDGRSQYWVVNTLDILSEDGKLGRGTLRSLPELETALEKMEREEVERLRSQEEDHESWDAEVEHAESSLWLQYMKWPAQFANRPLEIIAAAARKPALEPFEDYELGVWNGSLQVSPVEDEIKIRAMLSLVDQMFQRCHETLDATSHRIRCWINTASTDGYYPHPLQGLQKKGSEDRYISLWQCFFCYGFRAWAIPRDLRPEIYGLVLNERQETI